MHAITETLCRLLAPILAFTADEAWEYPRPHRQRPSRSTSRSPNPAFAGSDSYRSPSIELLKVRAVIQQAIEKARQEKRIGSNLEATVEVTLPPRSFKHPVFEDQATLEEFFILSVLTIKRGPAPNQLPSCWSPRTRSAPAAGSTCPVGQQKHADLCDRCEEACRSSPTSRVPTLSSRLARSEHGLVHPSCLVVELPIP